MHRALAVFVFVAASQAGAQRPDLSGTWVRVDSAAPARTVAATGDASFPRGDMGTSWGSPVTITQDANRLVVVFDYFTSYDLQPKVRLTYALDGSESRNGVITGQSGAHTRSTATWNGATLTIATQYPAPSGVNLPAGALDVRQELALDAQGRLTVRTTRLGASGALNTVSAVYTRR